MYIFAPNIKFLCVTMCLGGLYTDNDSDANTDKDTDDGQSTIVDSLVDKPNEPKSVNMNTQYSTTKPDIIHDSWTTV